MSEERRTATPPESGHSVFEVHRTASFLGFDPRPDRVRPQVMISGLDMSLPEPAKIPRVATFFALYPEPLGLQDGSTFTIALTIPISGFGKTAMHIKEGAKRHIGYIQRFPSQ